MIDDEEAEKKALCDFGAGEAEGGGEGWVEDGKAVEDHSDGEEEIDECGDDDPPAVEDSRGGAECGVLLRWLHLDCGASVRV